MIKLSKRMEAVAHLVTPGSVVCDVGTDHGYIPIYLLQKGVCTCALAMDVNEGPLKHAREHIAENGLADYIGTRRSDGLVAMREAECDSVVIAGMGGGLMIRILSDSFSKLEAVKELILQPQSDIELVREFVENHGFTIDRQDMVKEDGKYYMMFRCVHSKVAGRSAESLKAVFADCKAEVLEQLQTACDRYGLQNLQEKHPVLVEYLAREERVIAQIRQSLKGQKDEEKAAKRLAELNAKQQVLDMARQIMEKSGYEVQTDC